MGFFTHEISLCYAQMILNGEAQCARQIVTVSNSDGKVIAYAKPHYPMVDTALLSSNGSLDKLRFLLSK